MVKAEIALEDLQDGWLKSGTVGQEVYGAGNAFGILPRHYLQVPGEEFMVYIDYPTSGFTATKGKNIHFNILGDKSQNCRMMVVKTETAKLPRFTVMLKGKNDPMRGSTVQNGNQEFILNGDQRIQLTWEHKISCSSNIKKS